ncbi:hypothetical protein [Falsiroseomonas sp.]|uniref:hypothetical protein n=1 Tax=Falsiroseomonas sp. TaxID=2870721 RepID=UPI003F6ED8C8
MTQPGMLVLLSAADAALWQRDAAVLRRAGHLPLDAAALEAALAEGGPATPVARRLAAACDAALLDAAPCLAGVFRSLRRPVYASPWQLPEAGRAPPQRRWPSGWVLDAALRSLDR